MKQSEIDRLKAEILTADAVVIGAGAGLSASAGFTYNGERFTKYFSDFQKKYGVKDMYSGGFYHFSTPEEHWAYWSRYIYINRYMNPPLPVYKQLYELVQDKDYFVITTNVDHCFQKAGFDKKRLFYTQGDYGLFQCSEPCCQKTYDNEKLVYRMIREQKNMHIPSCLVPHCPVCGKEMTMNLRADCRFVQDEGWYEAENRYRLFLQQNQLKKVLFLELGVGMNTPGIIKFSFWEMVHSWPQASYICMSLDDAFVPEQIADKSMCISEDIGKVIGQIV